VEADSQRLPLDDETFDAAMMISMLHHVEDRGGRWPSRAGFSGAADSFVLMGFTGEDAATLWVLDYFPVSRPWMEATHPPRAAFLAELPAAQLFANAERASSSGSSATTLTICKRDLHGCETTSKPGAPRSTTVRPRC
jgi:hypothetical protein